MSQWSLFREVELGEKGEAEIHLADLLSSDCALFSADDGNSIFPDHADEVFANGARRATGLCAQEAAHLEPEDHRPALPRQVGQPAGAHSSCARAMTAWSKPGKGVQAPGTGNGRDAVVRVSAGMGSTTVMAVLRAVRAPTRYESTGAIG